MDPLARQAGVAAAAIAGALALGVEPGHCLLLGAAVLGVAILLDWIQKKTDAAPKPVDSQAEATSATELATLRAVVDGLAEGLWITGPDGTVVQHNDSLKEMLYAGIELL